MARKRYTAEQIIGKRREAEVALAQGENVGKVARRLGVAEQTSDRWRREYGGLRVDQAKRLKELERENVRRKTRVADQALDNAMLRDVAAGNVCARPSGAGRHPPAPTQSPVSERRACQVTGQARATQRSVRQPSTDAPARIARIVALATRFGRSGSRRITAGLRQAGWRVNHTRVDRLWRQEGLRGPAKHPPAGLSLAGGRRADAATGGAPPPCLVRRRRLRPDRRRAAPPVAGHRGRVHAGVPPPRRRPAAAPRRRPGPPRPALRRAGPTDRPPLRQRPSVHRHPGPRLADAGRRDHALH